MASGDSILTVQTSPNPQHSKDSHKKNPHSILTHIMQIFFSFLATELYNKDPIQLDVLNIPHKNLIAQPTSYTS